MPVLVDVEYIFFLAEGGRTNVSFVATFDVGVQADVTESTMISYASSDANVATVDASQAGSLSPELVQDTAQPAFPSPFP